VPANFPTNTTLVSGLSAGYSAANHGHNYVTSLNNLTGNLTLSAGSNVTLTANGSTLTIDSSGGSSFDGNATVDGGDYTGSVIPIITITSQPARQVISNGTVAFSVSASVTQGATLAYQWEKQEAAGGSFAAVSGATSSTLSLSSLTDQADGGDRYRVVASASGAASVTSDSARIVAGAVDWTIIGADYWPAYQSSMAATFASRTVSDSVSTAGLTPGGNTWYTGGVLLPDGNVLVIPYAAQYPTLYNVAANFAYNLSSSNWSPAPSPNGANPNGISYGRGAVLLPNGRVFYLSRWAGGSQVWDPAANTSTVVSALNQYQQFSRCVLMADGRVFLMPYVSNYGGDNTAKAAGIFNPATGALSATSDTFPAIQPPSGSQGSESYARACLLSDGRVYVTPAVSGQARLYNPQTGAVTAAGGTYSNTTIGSLLLNDGTVLVVEYGASSNSLRIYNPDSDTLSSSIATGSFAGGMSLLPNGKVLVSRSDASPVLFDTSSQTTTASSVNSSGNAWHAPLLDGRVLLLKPNSQAALYGGSGGFNQNVSLSAYYNYV
jgi:hypothetical protein